MPKSIHSGDYIDFNRRIMVAISWNSYYHRKRTFASITSVCLSIDS